VSKKVRRQIEAEFGPRGGGRPHVGGAVRLVKRTFARRGKGDLVAIAKLYERTGKLPRPVLLLSGVRFAISGESADIDPRGTWRVAGTKKRVLGVKPRQLAALYNEVSTGEVVDTYTDVEKGALRELLLVMAGIEMNPGPHCKPGPMRVRPEITRCAECGVKLLPTQNPYLKTHPSGPMVYRPVQSEVKHDTVELTPLPVGPVPSDDMHLPPAPLCAASCAAAAASPIPVSAVAAAAAVPDVVPLPPLDRSRSVSKDGKERARRDDPGRGSRGKKKNAVVKMREDGEEYTEPVAPKKEKEEKEEKEPLYGYVVDPKDYGALFRSHFGGLYLSWFVTEKRLISGIENGKLVVRDDRVAPSLSVERIRRPIELRCLQTSQDPVWFWLLMLLCCTFVAYLGGSQIRLMFGVAYGLFVTEPLSGVDEAPFTQLLFSSLTTVKLLRGPIYVLLGRLIALTSPFLIVFVLYRVVYFWLFATLPCITYPPFFVSSVLNDVDRTINESTFKKSIETRMARSASIPIKSIDDFEIREGTRAVCLFALRRSPFSLRPAPSFLLVPAANSSLVLGLPSSPSPVPPQMSPLSSAPVVSQLPSSVFLPSESIAPSSAQSCPAVVCLDMSRSY